MPNPVVLAVILADAQSRNQITPELVAAQHDPVVRFAHALEFAGAVVIVFLMVAKPF